MWVSIKYIFFDFPYSHNYWVILNYVRKTSCNLLTSQKIKWKMKNSLKCPLSFWNDSSSFLAAKSGERLAAICGDAWRVRFYTPEQVGRICQYLEGYFIFLHGSCIKVTCFTLILLVFLALFKKDSIRRNEQKKKIY